MIEPTSPPPAPPADPPIRVYVASSWRNPVQPHAVEVLRAAGIDAYDFRNPHEGDYGFSWREISPDWEQWSVAEMVAALEHPTSLRGYGLDWSAMEAAHARVLVLPCGRSAHLEAGYFVGACKPLHVWLPNIEETEGTFDMEQRFAELYPDRVFYDVPNGYEPELMYRMAYEVGGVVSAQLEPIVAALRTFGGGS